MYQRRQKRSSQHYIKPSFATKASASPHNVFIDHQEANNLNKCRVCYNVRRTGHAMHHYAHFQEFRFTWHYRKIDRILRPFRYQFHCTTHGQGLHNFLNIYNIDICTGCKHWIRTITVRVWRPWSRWRNTSMWVMDLFRLSSFRTSARRRATQHTYIFPRQYRIPGSWLFDHVCHLHRIILWRLTSALRTSFFRSCLWHQIVWQLVVSSFSSWCSQGNIGVC